MVFSSTSSLTLHEHHILILIAEVDRNQTDVPHNQLLTGGVTIPQIGMSI